MDYIYWHNDFMKYHTKSPSLRELKKWAFYRLFSCILFQNHESQHEAGAEHCKLWYAKLSPG